MGTQELRDNPFECLGDLAPQYHIRVSRRQLGLFRVHLQELWLWNRRMNLTGLGTCEKMVVELFLDSLIPAPFLPEEGRLLDVGSGAGFPGLPLKIYSPGLRTRLLEPNQKKVRFLRQVIRLLKLPGLEVTPGRVDGGASTVAGGGYDVVTARAVAPPWRIIPWCEPCLSRRGRLVCFLGREADRTLEEMDPVLERHDLVLERRIPYLLPGKKVSRTTLILKRKRAED